MIIKANCLKNGKKLAVYLLTENDRQQIIVLGIRGSLMEDLQSTLNAWEKEALAITKGEKPLYNVKIRLAPGETLRNEQWLQTLEVMESKLHLSNQPRAIVAHYLDGEPHLHVVYSRLDRDQGKLLKMSHDRRQLHATARQMEREFGLRELDSAPKRMRNGNQKTRSVEYKMAKESGISRSALCDMVKTAWEASTTGRQFEALLAPYGMHLTPGERRDFNLWHAGKRYDPVRLLEEVRTAEFRVKMRRDPPICQPSPLTPENICNQQEPVRVRAKHLTHQAYAAELTGQTIPATQQAPAPQLVPRRAKNLTATDANRLITAPPETQPAISWEEYVAQRAEQRETRSPEHYETLSLDL
ncbi:hypothetical protein CCAX7_46230 [Capsulimonas corticalis]|uniref:MobA/VirD2-like nuclease domain-containing protein n=1 Tax=Capsulimonas corticalis TaxID=2219043 RepID=A0A402D587_9BACT|nr:relaxase/mobilization nuclease domain-containing protein [Capsulimonas corticalis]BDI32572.1 hypothetical protein CCAX7_46230 [Capsulimonas corticalis]